MDPIPFKRISNDTIIPILKISDWTGNTYQDRRHMNKYNAQIGAGGTQYAYYHEEDESSFQLVSQLFLENFAAQMCYNNYLGKTGNNGKLWYIMLLIGRHFKILTSDVWKRTVL